MERLRFKNIGKTPNHGDIYEKGKVQIVLYNNGARKYWPFGFPGKCWHRDSWGYIEIVN